MICLYNLLIGFTRNKVEQPLKRRGVTRKIKNEENNRKVD